MTEKENLALIELAKILVTKIPHPKAEPSCEEIVPLQRMGSRPTLTAEKCPNCGALDWYQMWNVRCCFRCAAAATVEAEEAATEGVQRRSTGI